FVFALPLSDSLSLICCLETSPSFSSPSETSPSLQPFQPKVLTCALRFSLLLSAEAPRFLPMHAYEVSGCRRFDLPLLMRTVGIWFCHSGDPGKTWAALFVSRCSEPVSGECRRLQSISRSPLASPSEKPQLSYEQQRAFNTKQCAEGGGSGRTEGNSHCWCG
ncbi:hypothetical protein EJ110_NYTH29362, partial [Nymphaea thermarum]